MHRNIRVNPKRIPGARQKRARFTLTEMLVFASVMLVLTAILVPTLQSQARVSDLLQTRRDVQAIGQAIIQYYQDTRHLPGTLDYSGAVATGREGRKVQVLVSGGSRPAVAPRVGADGWLEASADQLSTYLMQPPPGYTPTSPSRATWRGPYLDAVPLADPWGNRYMVNIGLYDPSPGALDEQGNMKKAIFVISAGPNGQIDTPYEQPANAASVYGDDIAHRMR